MAAGPDPFPKATVETEDYNPESQREKLRVGITLIFAVSFFFIVTFYLYQSSKTGGSWPQVKEAMQSVLPAVTSVLGTTLGFYFGSQNR